MKYYKIDKNKIKNFKLNEISQECNVTKQYLSKLTTGNLQISENNKNFINLKDFLYLSGESFVIDKEKIQNDYNVDEIAKKLKMGKSTIYKYLSGEISVSEKNKNLEFWEKYKKL